MAKNTYSITGTVAGTGEHTEFGKPVAGSVAVQLRFPESGNETPMSFQLLDTKDEAKCIRGKEITLQGSIDFRYSKASNRMYSSLGAATVNSAPTPTPTK